MAIEEGLQNEVMNSDANIQAVLQNFELQEADLSRDQSVKQLATKVGERLIDGITMVSLVGGAASGKSTLAEELVRELRSQGVAADSIGTDDLNKEDREWRRRNFEGDNPPDPRGKYDSPLLFKLIEKIKNLQDGETVDVPVYDEKTGLAADAPIWPHKIGKVDVLLVQGDFHFIENPDFLIYLHLPDEQRLENRKRRDANHREPNEQAVIDIFNYRQGNQHFPHTLPNAEKADMIIVADASNHELWKYDIYERRTTTTED